MDTTKHNNRLTGEFTGFEFPLSGKLVDRSRPAGAGGLEDGVFFGGHLRQANTG